MKPLIRTVAAFVLALTVPGHRPVYAATLEAATIAAFEKYVAESDRQAAPGLSDPSRFIWPDTRRPEDLAALHAGQLLITRVQTRLDGRAIEVPGGMIHHWLGVVFVRGATLNGVVSLLQDYDRHAEVYRPAVAGSRLIERNGETFRVFLRFFMKKVITVVVNSEHLATFTRPDPTRAYSRIVSTRIAEVENPDTPGEKEKPVGSGGGYVWRLNSYWRFLDREGGTYVQCESITLTRGLPAIIGTLVRPFVTSIPRDTLTFTLEATRKALSGAD